MTITIDVEGMSCGGCERTVEEALGDLEGVRDVDADRTTDTATVEGEADVASLVATVEDAGYGASA